MITTGIGMISGSLVLFAIGKTLGEGLILPKPGSSGAIMSAFLYLVLFSSCLACCCSQWLVKLEKPLLVSSYAYFNPLIAILAGKVLGGEALSPELLPGSGAILSRLVLMSWRKKGFNSDELTKK
jgi:drug/metabolite transporter (DMT)-like permease